MRSAALLRLSKYPSHQDAASAAPALTDQQRRQVTAAQADFDAAWIARLDGVFAIGSPNGPYAVQQVRQRAIVIEQVEVHAGDIARSRPRIAPKVDFELQAMCFLRWIGQNQRRVQGQRGLGPRRGSPASQVWRALACQRRHCAPAHQAAADQCTEVIGHAKVVSGAADEPDHDAQRPQDRIYEGRHQQPQ